MNQIYFLPSDHFLEDLFPFTISAPCLDVSLRDGSVTSTVERRASGSALSLAYSEDLSWLQARTRTCSSALELLLALELVSSTRLCRHGSRNLQRLITEAQILLWSSPLTVSVFSFQLGFPVAYRSRYRYHHCLLAQLWCSEHFKCVLQMEVPVCYPPQFLQDHS